MPHYQPWGASAQPNQLPPTPPDYQGSYLTPMSAVSDHGFYPAPNYHGRSSSSGETGDRYGNTYPPTRSLSTHSHHHISHMPTAEYPIQGYPPPVMPQFQYPAGPMLPPIRSVDSIDTYGQGFAQQQPPKKEEKPTGGVAQHLDYEMGLMAAFVAEMSQDLVNPSTTPSAQFRKYVSQILSSTRLPSSTILLGLFYLAARMKIVNEQSQDVSSPGKVYRMLTTCLLLGSKFLDDNTFQNRSWAEVSSIPVQELNTMELTWLDGFNWEIHRIFHKDGDLDKWIAHWHLYEKRAKVAKVKDMQKLAPIDTSIRHSHPGHQPVLMSPDGPIPPQYQSGPQYDTHWARSYFCEYSPPSAPHSGPATPEYYSNWSYAQTPTSFGRYSNRSAYGSQPPYTQTPSYNGHGYGYGQGAWSGLGANCGSTLGAKHPEYYLTQTGYGLQTVVG
ncbi:hypothetical protein DV736_g4497, partial [Chaetothyriales sp. CBS 134916]